MPKDNVLQLGRERFSYRLHYRLVSLSYEIKSCVFNFILFLLRNLNPIFYGNKLHRKRWQWNWKISTNFSAIRTMKVRLIDNCPLSTLVMIFLNIYSIVNFENRIFFSFLYLFVMTYLKKIHISATNIKNNNYYHIAINIRSTTKLK